MSGCATPAQQGHGHTLSRLGATPRRGSLARPLRGGMSALRMHVAVRGPHRGHHIPWVLPSVRCHVSTMTMSHVLHRCRCPKPSALLLLDAPPSLIFRCRQSSPCSRTSWIWGHTMCGLSGSASLISFPAASRGAVSLACGPFPLVTAGSAASSVSVALTRPPPRYEDAGPLGTQGRPHVPMFHLIASAQFL